MDIDRLNEYLIEDSASILQALKRIDSNRKRFLIVVRDSFFLGTLTDGDIRRALILGKSVEDMITDIYIRNTTFLSSREDFSKAIDLMADERIDFLPIVDSSGNLVNILTKKQLQVALLFNLQADLGYNFLELDDSIIEHAITKKPWGFYKTTVLNNFYQSKILCLDPSSAISLQRHRFREEYWFVVFGIGEAQIGDSKIQLNAGSNVFIPKGCKHRLINKANDITLVVVEVQLGECFDEDDIERIDDEYGRY